MPRRPPKRKPDPLAGESNPTAPLDAAAFLDQARKVCADLGEDLLKRADGSPGVTAGLRARWSDEAAKNRTADGYEVWRRRFVGQVAAAWVLSLVFVRTLEDRGALARARLAGPGVMDWQKQFFEFAPSLTERDYLLTVFRELSRLPGAKHLFDAKHNPVWMLAPSAEGARRLLSLFRAPEAEAPAFRFGQADTRFLGDLYQDLDDEVKSRYALLQTPRFVENFILDRTLEPAIEAFGLDGTTVIDPTCGSGHFLLGAFERLFDKRLVAQPGAGAREAAKFALDAVYGVDLNPYAVAIARFRLTLAFMDEAEYDKIADLPELPMRLVVADSLLHGEAKGQRGFGDLSGQSAAAWKGEEYALEDDEGAKVILNKRYAAVVGNPPYIVPKDGALRKRYAELYLSAFMRYGLAAPFTERFFQLARPKGLVGMINANSFMKREFGKKLIEQYLPTVNVSLIVNTSGAYIPGHGTPTVLLFGSAEEPVGVDVLAVLAKRGEPTTPEFPEEGVVWKSITVYWSDVGFENEFVSVVRLPRTTLAKHPWSLGGGGAAELKEILEERTDARLKDIAEEIGPSIFVGEEEVYAFSNEVGVPRGLRTRPLVVGEGIRDWSILSSGMLIFPYDDDLVLCATEPLIRHAWPFRRTLEEGVVSGSTTMKELGRPWYELRRLSREKLKARLPITFAEVTTHNHFSIAQRGMAFKQTAPVIRLQGKATEDNHLALLAYLNSSTACFLMKQVAMNKGGSGIGRGVQDEAWEARFQFDGTKLGSIPLPKVERASFFAREILTQAEMREASMPAAVIAKYVPGDATPLAEQLHFMSRHADHVLASMVSLQEELDWLVYEAFGLLAAEELETLKRARGEALPHFPQSIHLRPEDVHRHGLFPGHRPFEIVLARDTRTSDTKTAWFSRNDYRSPYEITTEYAPSYQRLLEARVQIIDQNPTIRILEQPEYKRRWTVRDHAAETKSAARASLLGTLEAQIEARSAVERAADLAAGALRDAKTQDLAALLFSDANLTKSIADLLAEDAVPFLAAYRYNDAGMEKRAAWERTWDLQRREDAGEKVGDIPVPEKYAREDYRDGRYFNLRGKLDVSKERFISYPGCESDDDNSPVYGWAGWNHLQQAQALASLYQRRKTEEGWAPDRLLPMLAGLDELAPWVKQWHNEPSEEFGGLRLGDYFADFVASECRELGLTLEQVQTWKPESKTKRKAKPAAPPKPAEIFAVRPRVDDAFGEALLVLSALVHAEHGRIARMTAARALFLLFTPDTLVARAPRAAKALAKAWLRHATERKLPPQLFAAAERQLLETGMLRREADPSSGGLVLIATEKTWAEADLDSWYHAEAKLALDVVAVMRDEDLAALGDSLAPEDQSTVLGRIA